MKFFAVKKRTLCVILICIILICSLVGVYYTVKATSTPKPKYTIVTERGMAE